MPGFSLKNVPPRLESLKLSLIHTDGLRLHGCGSCSSVSQYTQGEEGVTASTLCTDTQSKSGKGMQRFTIPEQSVTPARIASGAKHGDE